jgi:ABC-type Na+ efflux pump permease subunit
MFMLVTVLRQPNGVLATVMSLVPPFTPILMLLRQAMPNAAFQRGNRGWGWWASWSSPPQPYGPLPASSGWPS